MRRSTVAMLVILAILAGLYWYMQQPENVIQRAIQPTPTATTVSLGTLVGPENGSATGISIETNNGTSIQLDKSTGIWLIQEAGNNIPADPEVVENAAAGIASLRILSRLDPAPDPASTGLAQPLYRFSFRMSSGSTIAFNVGQKTVTQSGYYVQTADGNVYVVAAFGIDALTGLADFPPYLQTPTP